jgi:hypothetical protein
MSTPEGESYLYVNMSIVTDQIGDYVLMIQKERTNKICKCEWIPHPDDAYKPIGERRMRRGEQSLECPVHTKEGFLLGFLNYLVEQAGKPAIELPNITGVRNQPGITLVSTVDRGVPRCDWNYGKPNQCVYANGHHDDHWPENGKWDD